MTLRRGLYESRNVVTVKLLEKVGIYNAVNTAYKMGVTNKLNRDLTLALGTSAVSLEDLVNGYCTLANQGVHVEPVSNPQRARRGRQGAGGIQRPRPRTCSSRPWPMW